MRSLLPLPPHPPQRPPASGFKQALSRLGTLADDLTKLNEKKEELKTERASTLSAVRKFVPAFDPEAHGSSALIPAGGPLPDARRLARLDAHINYLLAKRRLIANRVAVADKQVEIQVAEHNVARLRERGAMARPPAGASQGVDDF